MQHEARRCPARGSSIRRSWRGSATSSCSRGPSSTASSTACTARRTSARRSTSPSTAATSPGDDIRRVDWRLYARTDRYYVKQYEADTNTNFSVLLDISQSMSFAQPRRLEARIRAAISAACLAYLAHRQRDRVGIITFDSDIVDARAAVGEALQRGAAHARSREGRAARPPERAAQQDGRALQAARHPAC